ncbi:MAG TPA: aminotransferase class I/II-fold pyridoxal phosphate-dependent enzyme, partial [Atopostipes sp.]|nr:aminotransferase class I/II-fold pyridoxal phosphate-dependent enzyme [Atopostipes sp.]
LKRHYGLDYDADKQILVTVGVTEALSVAANALLNPGEKVIIPEPYFSLYDNVIKTAHGVPVYVDTSEDEFVLTAEKLDEILLREENVKYVLLNYPSNPTGTSYSEEELKDLAEVIKKHGVYCVADEVYADLTYDGFKHKSIAKFIPDQTTVLNGLSKSFAMTGMRVGYMAIPEEIYQTFYVVHQSTVTCVSTPAQMAAAVALRDGDKEMEKMRQAYEERRNYLIPAFEKLGFDLASPVGAFYLFLKIPENQNQDDKAFALELAKNAKVGLIPGSAFGQGGAGYVRLSYAASLENLKEAVSRLNRYLLKQSI